MYFFTSSLQWIIEPRVSDILMKWYIVQTKPWEEEKALFFLNQKGIYTYRPRMEAYFYRGMKVIKREKSLFPNYVFVRCNENELSTACWTWGVKKVLWRNDLPVSVSDELVESIRLLEDKDGVIKKRKVQELKRNDIVKIKSGPFRDLLAIFDHWDSDMERVCLLIDLVNTVARIHVPAHVVEKL